MKRIFIVALFTASCAFHIDPAATVHVPQACTLDGQTWSLTVPIDWACRDNYADSATDPPYAAVVVNDWPRLPLERGAFSAVVQSVTLAVHHNVTSVQQVSVGDSAGSLVEYDDGSLVMTQLAFQCGDVGTVVKCASTNARGLEACRSIVSSIDVVCPQ